MNHKMSLLSEKYKNWIIAKADKSLMEIPMHITDVTSDQNPGGIHDYYSNGDYWWPNPETSNGLPYIQRDGESNPNCFTAHREILRHTRTNIAHLAAGYLLTDKEVYAEKAIQFLKEFFIDDATKMNPHLLYAQAIPGICSGRGIGIIDTLHLIDIPMAIETIQHSSSCTPAILEQLKNWFKDYLRWISTHPYGIDEMNAHNNHSVCWYVQAACFAQFTSNNEILGYCTKQFKDVLIPEQMALDGSFPHELARTKPYGYSIFVLDNLTTLCHILSNYGENLWEFKLEDGRGIAKAFDFLYPYILNKNTWPYKKDVEAFDDWPVNVSSLLFAGLALNEEKYIALWEQLEIESANREIRRNVAIRQPILWL